MIEEIGIKAGVVVSEHLEQRRLHIQEANKEQNWRFSVMEEMFLPRVEWNSTSQSAGVVCRVSASHSWEALLCYQLVQSKDLIDLLWVWKMKVLSNHLPSLIFLETSPQIFSNGWRWSKQTLVSDFCLFVLLIFIDCCHSQRHVCLLWSTLGVPESWMRIL